VFVAAMVISIGSIGYLVFTNWFVSAKQTTESTAAEMNENINEQIYSYLHVPEQINESNHKIIVNGILDLSEENLRDKFFAGVIDSYEDEIYSFSYGSANGEYYGARRNENGEIQIMKNNASTGGNSWYYSVNDNLTAGELAVQAGLFDPRTRAWYKAAVEAEGPTFSPIYKHFVMNDLSISYACPVYNEEGTLEGVLGSHMLLNDIGAFLEDTVSHYNGYAVILEKSSSDLIANSMEIDNFTVLQDGTLERYDISKIQNTDILDAYTQYKTNQNPDFFYEGKDQNLYINIKEINIPGLDWVVVSAIPEDFLITPAVQSIRLAAILAILFLLLSFMIYTVITRRLLKPIHTLLQTTDALSSGDLTKRIDIIRNDEIGQISESFNKVADGMQFLVNNLENTVKERTNELKKAVSTSDENKNQLQLILDSAAEAIYGVDVHGNCTFCNISCIKMLGYNNQSELLGKNMHWQIHHTTRDGDPLPAEECKIFKAIKQGQGAHDDDEVFWRADGSNFDVEYFSYPQVNSGDIIGAVITFIDVSERKQKEAEIQYLNCYDTLTGLHNRRCFEENRAKIDTPDNLPLSVIFADINGLKMTNDIFGHSAGDELIKKSSEILQQVCRQNDIVARVGGDEFIMLLANTTGENAEMILSRIQSEFATARVQAIKCSISLGLDTKHSPNQSLDEIMANAENAMYKDKTMNRKSINKDIIDTIIETLHTRNHREKQHSINVSELSSDVGTALHFTEAEISKLKRAGYLHDIGKIVLDEEILTKNTLSNEEYEKMQQHSAVGYRILSLFDDTLDLAEYVYGHHERWDGNGYPRGVKGEQIPLLSRIITVAETYERVLNRGELPLKNRQLAALDAIKNGAGTQFDPQIAELFVRMISNKAV
jgi:diguanylate cyclase (GGDEF)-like protein/PAS domain S-box-containing protein